MSKILIVYGSSTGNTESIAEKLAKYFEEAGHDVAVQNAANTSPKHLADGHDAVLFGSSAWGMDEVELQDDFAPLFDAFDQMGLAGRKVAAFASGDTSYEHFGGAVDVIEARAKELGATIMADGLRVEGGASDDPGAVKEFAAAVLRAL